MVLEQESLSILDSILKKLDQKFSFLPTLEYSYDLKHFDKILSVIAGKLGDNYPYFHPLYLGQMLKPPHPIARLAYMLALWINPNNHALDGGRASSEMEKEVVSDLAKMFGWETHIGHLTSGGTIANLEALWIFSKRFPSKIILASELAHYTHSRISGVLSLDFESVSCDKQGKMNLVELETRLRGGTIGMVVVTMGTTGIGSVDPLERILKLKEKYHFYVHVDAAYGGYYSLVNNLSKETASHFKFLNQVDSIVIDPHKHGLQPYGCGCILFKDPSIGKYYKHDSPYTYFSSNQLHLGEISLECSRAGASAVALWATHQLLPPKRDSDFSSNLEKSRDAALDFYNKIKDDNRFLTIIKPELDIVTWAIKADNIAGISDLSKLVFKESAKQNLHLALINLPTKLLSKSWNYLDYNEGNVTCLRACLMKPEHGEWLERIWNILSDVTDLCLCAEELQ